MAPSRPFPTGSASSHFEAGCSNHSLRVLSSFTPLLHPQASARQNTTVTVLMDFIGKGDSWFNQQDTNYFSRMERQKC
jgi:hypothetical protein